MYSCDSSLSSSLEKKKWPSVSSRLNLTFAIISNDLDIDSSWFYFHRLLILVPFAKTCEALRVLCVVFYFVCFLNTFIFDTTRALSYIAWLSFSLVYICLRVRIEGFDIKALVSLSCCSSRSLFSYIRTKSLEFKKGEKGRGFEKDFFLQFWEKFFLKNMRILKKIKGLKKFSRGEYENKSSCFFLFLSFYFVLGLFLWDFSVRSRG
jgi:hypothetical protein